MLKLATLVVDLNENFSEDMSKRGHTYGFDKPSTGPTKTQAATSQSAGDSWGKGVDVGQSGKDFSQAKERIPMLGDFPELLELLEPKTECPLPWISDNINWIETIFRSSRGFELGTFGPAVLPIILKEQSKNWEGLALNYINSIVLVVHRFICNLLGIICPDDRLRSNLFSLMIESLLEKYKKAIDHVKFILLVERSGTPLMMNHYFAENLVKARQERVRSLMETHAFNPSGKPGVLGTVTIDALLNSAPISNAEHMVHDIHDILISYYKVARKRFVDTVCMQGADYHLVTGSNSPLRVFSPALISSLTLEQLDMIAGEELASRTKRQTLKQEIEALKKGKKLLTM